MVEMAQDNFGAAFSGLSGGPAMTIERLDRVTFRALRARVDHHLLPEPLRCAMSEQALANAFLDQDCFAALCLQWRQWCAACGVPCQTWPAYAWATDGWNFCLSGDTGDVICPLRMAIELRDEELIKRMIFSLDLAHAPICWREQAGRLVERLLRGVCGIDQAQRSYAHTCVWLVNAGALGPAGASAWSLARWRFCAIPERKELLRALGHTGSMELTPDEYMASGLAALVSSMDLRAMYSEYDPGLVDSLDAFERLLRQTPNCATQHVEACSGDALASGGNLLHVCAKVDQPLALLRVIDTLQDIGPQHLTAALRARDAHGHTAAQLAALALHTTNHRILESQDARHQAQGVLNELRSEILGSDAKYDDLQSSIS